jgi:NAD(P)-dependent dehydrogenase (short-subunit alcohol dehydrogenase family)
MRELKPTQSILITGASSGIGRACALHFAGLGFTVFAGVRQEADALALQEYSSGDLRPIILDVTSGDQIEAALEELSGCLAGDGLMGRVNNSRRSA